MCARAHALIRPRFVSVTIIVLPPHEAGEPVSSRSVFPDVEAMLSRHISRLKIDVKDRGRARRSANDGGDGVIWCFFYCAGGSVCTSSNTVL